MKPSSLSIYPILALACVARSSGAKFDSSGPKNTPPTAVSTTPLGYTEDPEFNPGIYRDSGGGGFINGYHVIGFGDSYTTANGLPNGSFTSFVHNTFAYFGIRNKTDPTHLTDFGSPPHANGLQTFLPSTLIATGNETNIKHTIVSIWPNSNILPLATGSQGFTVSTVFNASSLTALYNTMVVVNVTAPGVAAQQGGSLQTSRAVGRLFYQGENLYGSFSLYRYGQYSGEPMDNYLYLFSTSNSGIKVARVLPTNKYLRHYYYYWNGTTWSLDQPLLSDTVSNIINWNYTFYANNVQYGPGAGDIFWSNYFNTFICVFIGDGIMSNFYISFSQTQSILGPYSTPVLLYQTPIDPQCAVYSPNYELNYAGHAYPLWDATGKTLLLSYSSCNAFVSMVSVSFV